MGDWLGTGNVRRGKLREWRPFNEARDFVRSLHLAGRREWELYSQGRFLGHDKRPRDIPSSPHAVYRGKGWIGYPDWLGKNAYADFTVARAFVRLLGLRSWSQWESYCRGEMSHLPALPLHIPKSPQRVYIKKEWNGIGDWLGKE